VACEDDALTLCGDIEKGKGRVMRCLMDKKESLSENCRKELAEARPHKMKDKKK